MLMSSIFDENIFDESFRDPFFDSKDMKKLEKKLCGRRGKNLTKTDTRETDTGYELEMGLPGFRKDEIRASLRDGHPTISAAKGLDKDEREKTSDRYIRQERYAGACERSFYVGEDMTEDDIKGEFKHGILGPSIPKREVKPLAEEKKYIPIEE